MLEAVCVDNLKFDVEPGWSPRERVTFGFFHVVSDFSLVVLDIMVVYNNVKLRTSVSWSEVS